MPSIASRLIPRPTEPVDGPVPPVVTLPRPPIPVAAPPISPTLRCPLPVQFTNSPPDSLRQYYAGGQVPQYRINPPGPISPAQAGSISTTQIIYKSTKASPTGNQSPGGTIVPVQIVGGGGGVAGVAQIIAGADISISPVGGTGVVTISATGSVSNEDFSIVFMLMGG